MIYNLRFTIWERTAALLSGLKFKRKFHVLSHPTQSARAGAVQDALRSPTPRFARSVLDCGGPPPLFDRL